MSTIAITGAASGICAAAAARLAGEGHRIIGVDVQPTDVVADLGTKEGRVDAVEGVRALCDGSLDGLVSGAALGPYADPEAIIRVNYFGAVAFLESLKDELARGDEPAAVTISSIGAIFADVAPEQGVPACVEACLAWDEDAAVAAIEGSDGTTAYSCAKRALAYKTRALAAEWGAAGVRLNAVAPGTTETPMLDQIYETPEIAGPVRALPIPLGRTAPAEELASVVCFLLGPDARFVHGAVIHADGGSDALVRPTTI